jgi:hypothetical protein
LDCESFRLDALDHAKEEIRSHYETYVSIVDTLLLVMALIWPFALNTIQYSDAFVLKTEEECLNGDYPDGCIEVEYPWLVGMWIGLIGLVLILPFWGILMLIRCRLKLAQWLEYCLAGLNRERREIVSNRCPETDDVRDRQTGQVVLDLVNVAFEYQDYLSRIWRSECAWLVRTASMFLWLSAVAAVVVTGLSLWTFFFNKGGAHKQYSTLFLLMISAGCFAPALYLLKQHFRTNVPRPHFETHDIGESQFPLTSPRSRVRTKSRLFDDVAEVTGSPADVYRSNPSTGTVAVPLLPPVGSRERNGSSPAGRHPYFLGCLKRSRKTLNLPLLPSTME